MTTTFVITCEHGGNRIPPKYWPRFKRHRALLESHRGFDPGALALARDLSRALDSELVYSTTSRLLVELNRSPGHPQLFSEITAPLPPDERERLLARYYFPYREWVELQVRQAVERGTHAVHLSTHSFTPRLGGLERRADLGLLYDPRRPAEARLARACQAEIRRALPGVVVRRNYPYRGNADGLTTALRKRFADPSYCGIEIEVNQRHALGEASAWRRFRRTLAATLARVLHAWT